MSLRRRNIIAYMLILVAAITWAWGQQLIQNISTYDYATTAPATYTTIDATTIAPTHSARGTTPNRNNSTLPTGAVYPETIEADYHSQRNTGFILCAVGAGVALAAMFLLWQKAPLYGPDGAVLFLGMVGLFKRDLLTGDYEIDIWIYAFLTAIVLCSTRELWGWIRSRFSLSWCAVRRLAQRYAAPQLSLLVHVCWILAAVLVSWWLSNQFVVSDFTFTYGCITAAGLFAIACLWQYGVDLHHFQKQLANFRSGAPITVRGGTFGQDEQQLQQIQAQHEEAIRKAVTSERFKVELISNVSHDLRTPLTSILGYGELLQKETLSPAGQEQLFRLNQKAGYMRDLVESLFELTKVSSGVMESKREQIDLIRLLEQTIGLFDDQLTQAGLLVRRSYGMDTAAIITDGARMHQVFANLLGNAIKYAMPGTRIYLEVKERGQHFVVRMMNTASYEMDFQPEEIVQRFARGDKARSTKGSGLGLAIAQTYTESVGGQFRVAVDGDQFSAIVELPKNERNL